MRAAILALALALVTAVWITLGWVSSASAGSQQVAESKQAQRPDAALAASAPAAPGACGALRILLVKSYSPATVIANQVKAHANVAVVDTFDAFNNTPTLSQLQSYDLVFTVGSMGYKDRAALGDVLASYVDGGGVVVQTGTDWLTDYSVQGRWATQGYSPYNPNTFDLTSDSMGEHDAGHALMQNVGSLGAVEKAQVTLTGGTTQVAQYVTTHLPLVAVKNRAVGINADLQDVAHWVGDFHWVIVNAANSIHGYSCPPASATPTTTGTPPTATASPSASPTPMCDLRYSDVPSSNPFYSYIECLACKGVVSGYGDGTFRPNDLLTRGQLSKIVSQAAGFREPVMEQTYTDVAPDSPFYNYIGRLSSRNVISGYPCGRADEECDENDRPYFRPNAPASRGQLSKIVSNTAEFTEEAGPQLFSDVAPGSPFYDYINRLANRQVISGYPCGGAGETCDGQDRPYFRPNFNVTRGQASKIVANTFFPSCHNQN
jgi:hypothetical protein